MARDEVRRNFRGDNYALTTEVDNVFPDGVVIPSIASPINPPVLNGLYITTDVGGRYQPAFIDSNGLHHNLVRDLHLVGRNASGATIPTVAPVQAVGYYAAANLVQVALADADALATMPAIGITMGAMNNNGNGRIVTKGWLANVDTSAFTAGLPLFVSGAGTLTHTPPVYPAYRQAVGTVLSVNATTGIILVDVSSSFDQAGSPVPAVFFSGSTLVVATGVGRWICTTRLAGTITEIRAAVNTAPTGAALNLSVKKNGVQFTTLSIAAGAFSGSSLALTTPLAAGDYITVDVTQVGSTVAGSDLVVVGEIITSGS